MALLPCAGNTSLFAVLLLLLVSLIKADRITYSRSDLFAFVPGHSVPPVFHAGVPFRVKRLLFPLVKIKKSKSGLRRTSFIFQNVNGKDSFLNRLPEQRFLTKACFTFFSETMKLEARCVNSFPGKKYYSVPASPALSVNNAGRPRGGLELYVSPSLQPRLISSDSSHIAVHLQTIDLIAVGVYLHPDLEPEERLGAIQNILQARIAGKKCVIGGDFNVHPDDAVFDELSDLLNQQNIGICSDITEPTFFSHRGSTATIDYIFTSYGIISNRFTSVSNDNCLASDHCTLTLKTRCQQNYEIKPPQYSHARNINFNNLENFLASDQNVGTICHKEKAVWVDKVLYDSSSSVVPKPPRRKGWWSLELLDLRRNAIKLFKRYKSKQDSVSYKAYSVARAAFHKQCKAAKKLFSINQCFKFLELAKSNGISELFKSLRSKSSSAACPIGPEVLREACMKLYACFPIPSFMAIPSCHDPSNPLITPISLEELTIAQRRLKSKAPSLYGFSPYQVKLLIPYISDILLDIFNKSLITGIFPENWLESCLFFIYKKGDRSDPGNYRNISIENPFLKCFMKIIQRRLYHFAELNGILPIFQFGFRRGHSTTAAACLLQEVGVEYLSNRKRVYACFFDFRKAFDLVDRSLLITKLQILGIPRSFCSLLFFILENLKLHVRSGSTVSESFKTLNGVPQGDAISPILFSLFTSDLPGRLTHRAPSLNSIKIPYILFADDLVLLAESKDELQSAINSVSAYCLDYNISINVDKTKYMVFYNGRLPNRDYSVTLNGKTLNNNSSFTYLGFTFTTRIKFSMHSNLLSKRANAKIGVLFNKLKLHSLNIHLVLEVFKVYILPMFSYGLFIWFPHISTSARSMVDAVFSKYLKRYLRIPSHANNELTYFLTNSQPLSLTLNFLLQNSFNTLKLPSIFSGFKPIAASKIPDHVDTYSAFKLVPSFYWHNVIPTHFSSNPSSRHTIHRVCFDSIHYSYCSNPLFHKQNSDPWNNPCSCICRFCQQECSVLHYQICPNVRTV